MTPLGIVTSGLVALGIAIVAYVLGDEHGRNAAREDAWRTVQRERAASVTRAPSAVGPAATAVASAPGAVAPAADGAAVLDVVAGARKALGISVAMASGRYRCTNCGADMDDGQNDCEPDCEWHDLRAALDRLTVPGYGER